MEIRRSQLLYVPDAIFISWDNHKQCHVPGDQMGFLMTHQEVENLCDLLKKYLQTYTNQEIEEENKNLAISYSRKKPKTQTKRLKRKGHVYLLEDSGGYIKIGCSQDVKKRIENIQSNNPTIRVLRLIETSDIAGLESELHKAFANKRIKGEWFLLTKDDIKQIEEIVETAKQ